MTARKRFRLVSHEAFEAFRRTTIRLFVILFIFTDVFLLLAHLNTIEQQNLLKCSVRIMPDSIQTITRQHITIFVLFLWVAKRKTSVRAAVPYLRTRRPVFFFQSDRPLLIGLSDEARHFAARCVVDRTNLAGALTRSSSFISVVAVHQVGCCLWLIE